MLVIDLQHIYIRNVHQLTGLTKTGIEPSRKTLYCFPAIMNTSFSAAFKIVCEGKCTTNQCISEQETKFEDEEMLK